MENTECKAWGENKELFSFEMLGITRLEVFSGPDEFRHVAAQENNTEELPGMKEEGVSLPLQSKVDKKKLY